MKAAVLLPKIALLGTQGLKLKAIRLRGKNLKLEIGLLRLKGSAGNSTVQAFGQLAHAVVPKIVKKLNSMKPNSTTKL